MGPIANLIPLKGSAYPQRLAMGSRMITQALPLVNAESQLVQAAIPGTDDTFAHKYAERMGAVRSKVAGTVVDITPDTITVRGPDRRNHVVELYNEMPYNRKTTVHNTPLVRVGQRVSPGMLLAKSNFTDNDGTIALGVNARVGYIPYKGYSYEDAIVVSESFADRTTSEHMYQHTLDTGAGVQPDKNAHISIFQGKYPKKLLENYAPDGTIKPGTKVNPGEPLILAVKENTIGPRIGRRKSWADASVLWEHEAPGVVTDVAYGKRGINVIVKSTQKTRVGDKLCFDPETELLTRRGWKCVATIDSADELATLNPDNDCLEWHKPTMLHSYNHVGQMYRLVNRRVNMLVTPEHTLWACRPGKAYTKIAARDFYAARGEWYLKKDCLWQGVERALYVPPEHVAGSGRAHAFSTPVPMDVWLEFLGYYISEGSVHTQRKGGKYVRISQFKTSKHWKKIGECLDKLGLPWKYSDADQRFQVGSCALAAALAPCGHDAYTKRVPEYVQELSTRQLRIFFDAYMAGDGHRGVCWEFGTSSEQLSFDMSLIVFKLGYSTYTREVWGTGFQTHPHWRTRISRTQLRPYINKANVNKGKGTTEELTDYSGMVYCVTVANHLVYARRGGKSYWSGNSGQYG
jgi:biotin carboxyl carrier protein